MQEYETGETPEAKFVKGEPAISGDLSTDLTAVKISIE